MRMRELMNASPETRAVQFTILAIDQIGKCSENNTL